MSLRALTLHEPWAAIVAAGLKPIENRPWAPPKWILNTPIAIHAGRHWDIEGAEFIKGKLGPDVFAHHVIAYGAVVALATVVRVIGDTEMERALLTADELNWFFGPFGWVLRDVRALARPISCRGHQKLWNLPPQIERQVYEQLGDVISADG